MTSKNKSKNKRQNNEFTKKNQFMLSLVSIYFFHFGTPFVPYKTSGLRVEKKMQLSLALCKGTSGTSFTPKH